MESILDRANRESQRAMALSREMTGDSRTSSDEANVMTSSHCTHTHTGVRHAALADPKTQDLVLGPNGDLA
ncbi:hypothetical protein EMCRGX_G029321 [Ephydatia muelleri]